MRTMATIIGFLSGVTIMLASTAAAFAECPRFEGNALVRYEEVVIERIDLGEISQTLAAAGIALPTSREMEALVSGKAAAIIVKGHAGSQVLTRLLPFPTVGTPQAAVAWDGVRFTAMSREPLSEIFVGSFVLIVISFMCAWLSGTFVTSAARALPVQPGAGAIFTAMSVNLFVFALFGGESDILAKSMLFISGVLSVLVGLFLCARLISRTLEDVVVFPLFGGFVVSLFASMVFFAEKLNTQTLVLHVVLLALILVAIEYAAAWYARRRRLRLNAV